MIALIIKLFDRELSTRANLIVWDQSVVHKFYGIWNIVLEPHNEREDHLTSKTAVCVILEAFKHL